MEKKLKTRQYAFSRKYGHEKIRNILREKCRARVKEARSTCYELNRKLLTNTSLISKFLRQELSELEEDLNLQDLIYTELSDEVNNWFAEEFENEQNYLIDMGILNVIFCPICQKSQLTSLQGVLSCECGVSFSYYGTLDSFQARLHQIVAQHDMQCDQQLNFFVEPNPADPELNQLNAICEKCDRLKTL